MGWLAAVGLNSLAWLQGTHALSVLGASCRGISGGPLFKHPPADHTVTTLSSREISASLVSLAFSSPLSYQVHRGKTCGILATPVHRITGAGTISRKRRSAALTSLSSTEGFEEEEGGGERGKESWRRKGLLRRIVKRVVTTGRVIVRQASDGIRGEGGDDEAGDAQWYPENTYYSAPTRTTSAGASTGPSRETLAATAGTVVPRPPSRPPATPKLNAPVDTLPPGDSVRRSKSLVGRQVGGLPEWATRRSDRKERSEVGPEALDGSERAVAWSALDVAVRPLQAFAAFMQNHAEVAEGELSRRVSGLEESFTQEQAAMQKTLAGERLASKAKLKQAEEQLAQLRDLSAEKRRVEAGAKKLEAIAKQASASYDASLERFQAEVDSMKNRLEKEKASMAATQAEVVALRASQERERERAKESLAKLETELERERQMARAKQASIFEEMSARTREQSRALDLAEKRAAAADHERTRAEDSRAKAEARFQSAEETATSAMAESAKARERAEREVALAREQAAAAAATAAAAVEAAEEARSGSGIDRLEAELEAATAELRVQTKKARELDGAKERAEAKAARRNRGLEELMEKNRARSEKALAGLREQVKELEPLRVAAAGFEDVKADLGLAQNRSSQLEGEVATLTKKVEVLDQRLAQSTQRSLEEARVLERKQRALMEAEAQLQAARERSAQLEGDLVRVPSLQKRLGEAKEEAERQRIRADDLQAGRKRAVAQNELVKDRLFDLERSVEMTEWGERKLERENKGLQGLLEKNRTRYEREFARLKAASVDLVDKTAALEDLEAVVTREREQAEKLGRQVKILKEQSTATAAELIVTRDKLTKETEKRLRAEAALRQATDKSYVEKLQAAESAILKAQQEGQKAVERVQAMLREERASWDTERTTLSRRVEQATGSSKERNNELEDEAKLLRLESQQSKAQAEDLRGQLQRATSLVSETKAEKERLQGELVLARRAVEDGSTLQQSIKGDLNSFDESATPLEPSPRSPVESRGPDGGLLLQAREQLTEAAAFLSGLNEEENAERYRLLLNDSERRKNAEAASAIDEFSEKSQGTEVGANSADGSDSDLASSVPPASQVDFENREAYGSGNKGVSRWQKAIRIDERKRVGWSPRDGVRLVKRSDKATVDYSLAP